MMPASFWSSASRPVYVLNFQKDINVILFGIAIICDLSLHSECDDAFEIFNEERMGFPGIEGECSRNGRDHESKMTSRLQRYQFGETRIQFLSNQDAQFHDYISVDIQQLILFGFQSIPERLFQHH
jgi:hypothetical protein